MEALRFSFKEKKLELCHLNVPQVTDPNNVLVKVAYSGICGTDLHIIAGEFPCNQFAEITLGHEFSGTVAEVGHDVISLKEGDKVTVDPNSGCKRCSFCHAGKPHFCKVGCVVNTLGIYKDGGWANYVLCPEEQVHLLPAGISLEQAVLTEPVSCMAHGWDLISPVCVGEKVLILGAGIIGTLWVCILHHQGHRNVFVSEPNTVRLELVRKLNTGYVLLTPDQLRKNRDADPCKYSFDVVIDCSGSPPAIEQAVTFLNPGGKLCIFGVSPPQSKIQITPFDIYRKEIKIFGVNINPFTFPKAMGLLGAMGNRYMNFNNLGIKLFPLNQYSDAIDQLKKGSIAKAVFKM
ncbi:ADH N, Methyltransf 26 and/or Shikimate DH domain containing protein [Asbolus verrucosus]|uniref:ADH N, Methyltransf 26 and/or Shikimate DH domain containing protein n=1 Tax=Asbolus verrucosus TaxID=1661398 RepID=A0A482V1N7_ASBVE|nr:ADH N, Methyltransf 26 and/or Shikimate DH domain containing protein [Asbolus verrucosus]